MKRFQALPARVHVELWADPSTTKEPDFTVDVDLVADLGALPKTSAEADAMRWPKPQKAK